MMYFFLDYKKDYKNSSRKKILFNWFVCNSELEIIDFALNFKESNILKFQKSLKKSKYLIGHNIFFLLKYIISYISKVNYNVRKKYIIDTATSSITIWKRYSMPNIQILYKWLEQISDKKDKYENQILNILCLSKYFFRLVLLKRIFLTDLNNLSYINQIIKKINVISNTTDRNYLKLNFKSTKQREIKENLKHKMWSKYFNIHNHSNYSILNSTIEIKTLLKKVRKYKMEAVGLTDLGNLMGTVKFLKYIKNYNKNFNLNIKPIIGCEFYLSTKNKKNIYSQILIAKNKIGYYNLIKLCSLSSLKLEFDEYPVITKNMIKSYSSGLIALSGDLNSEISNLILNNQIKESIKQMKWWLKVFKQDFYLEIFRHGEKYENKVNRIILKLAKKYSVDYIIQNNVFYLNKKDHKSLRILLSIKYGEKIDDNLIPEKHYINTSEYYLKSKDKIYNLFSDLPLGLKNLRKLKKKISRYNIKEIRNLPKYYFHDFKIDNNVKQPYEYFENKLLKKITYNHAKTKYKFLKGDLIKRLNFELRIIEKINYPGYFLIISELVKEAKKKGILVGPGRGSVVGSVVAYAIGLTKIDPIKYNLLFERFLTKSRISLPDIDIDFDDKGREEIIKLVLKKYGRTKVSQIITYGTLGAKSAIRDTARVLDFPFNEINRLSKLIPNLTLKQLFKSSNNQLKKILNIKDYEKVLVLKKQKKINVCFKKVIKVAMQIEGNIKNTGIHACGILISPYDIIEKIPINYSKAYDCLVTQYDKKNIEQIGLLKIDFLGLRTLSIIKKALKIINKKTNQIKDLNKISLEDKETIKLFKSGKTIGIFQYESFGMQKSLKKLIPNSFEDLIIMNALYRPGPFKNLNNFISIKNGKLYKSYSLQELEEYLKETNGIIVYQEQVMLISQYISNFNKTKADTLRHAISKKNKFLLTSMKTSFIEGGIKKGHLKKILEDIWFNWQNFASYAFNKSHSASYTFLSFQAAFLKSHFPAEYMTSVLSNNMQNIKEISILIRECKKMGLTLACPNINLSSYKFRLRKKRIIYGLSAIKGIGKASIKNLIKHRKKKKFLSILDIVKRVNLRLVNKKVLENLAYAGAFDEFKNTHRAQYFYKEYGSNIIEKFLQFGSKYQLLIKNRKHTLLKKIKDIEIKEPKMTKCKKWSILEKIKKEKEVLGFYISNHPLEKMKSKINKITNLTITKFKSKLELKKKRIICGVVTNIELRKSRRQRDYIVCTIEDASDNINFFLYGKMYSKYKHIVTFKQVLLITLIDNKILSIKKF
ncbi:DNA polymerase III alpha subunit [Candidatus Karelsulcia muelleri]|uniref:DNA polymerase III subunit alpha n=2 Tax=Candidatus Karelsulcia muelleri TaxID=336810 RepID=A0A346E0T2_9FLAO|nr:DNA polymerase III alpha subunit [Candidatus Karelsulcia muelleri]